MADLVLSGEICAMKRVLIALLLLFLAEVAHPQADTSSIGVLPMEVSETSGLLFHNEHLITHNDSGNEPVLYVLDTLSLEVVRTVVVANAVNTDWEDLAMDETYIYIADIGNNRGDRTDLGIYRIEKQAFDASDTVLAEKISFAYEDQSDFSGTSNSDWDAEALIAVGDSLILFTKQWQSNGTVAYSLPKNPGDHQASRLEDYVSNGLITGATYNSTSQVVFLVGYSQQLFPFVVRVEEVQDTFTFGTNAIRSPLPLSFAQIEAIAEAGVNTYYMSSERFTNDSPPITLEPKLFKFSTEDTEPTDPPVDPPPPDDPPIDPMPDPDDIEDVLLFQAEGTNVLSYELGLENSLFGRAIFDATGRRIRYNSGTEILNNDIDLSTLGTAIYYLTFYFDGKVVSKAFYRR